MSDQFTILSGGDSTIEWDAERQAWHKVNRTFDQHGVTSTVEEWLTDTRTPAAVAACRVYWGSHGCSLERGHEGPHDCGCCECDDHEHDHAGEGYVAKPPYYGPDTNFWGEDA